MPKMTTEIEKIIDLLNKCLGFAASPENRLLIVFDRFGQDIADAVIEACSRIQPGSCAAAYLPVAEQKVAVSRNELPSHLRDQISASRILITCLTNSDECTRCRVLLLDQACVTGLKVLHMPGVDQAMFARGLSHLNFEALHSSAVAIQNTMIGVDIVTVYTLDSHGNRHELKLSIKGRQVHICGGIAQPGEIMNLPTGEVYVAPNEYISSGSVVLNGSTDNIVFAPEDDVILAFSGGKLDIAKSTFSDSATAASLRADLLDEERRNPDSMFLCELGIGVNDTIHQLSGDEILDEKAAGTIHIALGANKPFGGDLDGTYHRDMIFIPDIVLCDGQALRLPPPPSRWRKENR